MYDVEKMLPGAYIFQCPKRIIFGNNSMNQYGA